MRNVVGKALVTATVAASLAAGTAHATSLPYVTDLSGWQDHTATITVEYAGNQPSRIMVTDLKTHRRVKLDYVNRDDRAFCLGIKAGRTYRIQLRDGRRWRTIEYRAYEGVGSLPYVTDLGGWRNNRATVTVECATDRAMRLRVTDCKTHRRVKAHRDDRALWYMTVRAGHTYKIQTAQRNRNNWKTIWYRAEH